MNGSRVDLSICIVSWNTAPELIACLDSITGTVRKVQYEIIVVDNASQDGSPELVSARLPSVRLHVNSSNLGFAAAANQAIALSSGRYVLLLNPDAEVMPGTLDQLVSFTDSVPQAGVVGCKIVNPDGSLQYSCRRFPNLIAGMLRNTLLGSLLGQSRCVRDYLMQDWDHASVLDVDWVSGAALLVRREVVDQIGFLDEGFFMYCEDIDFCKRAGEAGWDVLYYPFAKILHRIGCSSSQNATHMTMAFHRSMYRYYAKHHRGSFAACARTVVALALVLRAAMVLGSARLQALRSDYQARLTAPAELERDANSP